MFENITYFQYYYRKKIVIRELELKPLISVYYNK